MSTKIKLFNGQLITIYGNYSKEELNEIKKIRNDQLREAQSRADITRDKMFQCTACGGNGCTLCGW